MLERVSVAASLKFLSSLPLFTNKNHQTDRSSVRMRLKSQRMEVSAERFQVEATRERVQRRPLHGRLVLMGSEEAPSSL